MLLARFIKNVVAGRPGAIDAPPDDRGRSVLNVGGASKQIPIPPYYDGWRHLLLDIKAGDGVDLVQDARELLHLPPDQFDAVYCSHNLEHYFRHDGDRVLAGFLHVLKDHGFADIRVPDIPAVVRSLADGAMDIDDVLYVSPGGPITVHDVIYGWGVEIERSGVDFFAHKRGFSMKSLRAACERAGFVSVTTTNQAAPFELRAFCFKQEPSSGTLHMLGLEAVNSQP